MDTVYSVIFDSECNEGCMDVVALFNDLGKAEGHIQKMVNEFNEQEDKEWFAEHLSIKKYNVK